MNATNNINSRIRVCVRLRPFIVEDNLSDERKDKSVCVRLKSDGQTVELLKGKTFPGDSNGSPIEKPKIFSFDHIFEPNSTQIEVYRLSLQPIVNDVLNGYNGTGIVYGQTGTGKTYTMFGSNEVLGIVDLAITQIFECVGSREDRLLMSKVSVCFYQIYVEQVFDLLTTHIEAKNIRTAVEIHEDSKKGAFLKNLNQIFTPDKESCLLIIKNGLKNRRIRSTYHNMKSSRSHTILQIHLDFEESNDTDNKNSNKLPDHQKTLNIRNRILTLVDLAGAERPNNYKNTTKQVNKINIDNCNFIFIMNDYKISTSRNLFLSTSLFPYLATVLTH